MESWCNLGTFVSREYSEFHGRELILFKQLEKSVTSFSVCAAVTKKMSFSWKGGATLAVGKPFQAQFELGDVAWATEYNNGAYVELRKQGEEELIDWYRLHEDRAGGFEWADSATPTEPGTYEFVLRSTGDPFEPAHAPETVQFLESCSVLEPGKYKLSGSETTDCAGNNTWPIKKVTRCCVVCI